jgi:PAS domain S-box-containing protein
MTTASEQQVSNASSASFPWIEPRRPPDTAHVAASLRALSIWPIIAVATAGMLVIGFSIAVMTRLTLEHQLQVWTGKSLRTAIEARVALIGQQLHTARVMADGVALHSKSRDGLERYAHGSLSKAQLLAICTEDLGDIPNRNALIKGIAILDGRGDPCVIIGRVPRRLAPAPPTDTNRTQMVLIDDQPALRQMTEIRSSRGELLGSEALFTSIADMGILFEQDMGFGPGLVRHLDALVDGRPMRLIPFTRDLPKSESDDLADRFAHLQQEPVLDLGEHGALSGIHVGVAEAGLLINLHLEPGLQQSQRSASIGWITGVLVALVALGSLGLLLVLLPMGRRILRQRAELDDTLVDLQRSEEFNRRISDSSPDGMVILDRSGMVDTINQSGLKMLQRGDINTVVGLPWISMWPEGDPARLLAHNALSAALDKRLGHFTASSRTRSGQVRWWDILVAPILDAGGHVDRLVCVFRDITHQHRAEQAVMVSEQRLRTVATATDDAIWDWNVISDAVWWNESVTSLFGYPASAVGPTITWWRERIHPDDQEAILSALTTLVAGRQNAWRAEYRFRNQDGTYTPVLDRGQVIRDATGTAQRVVSAMFNLTERRQREDFARRLSVQASLRGDVSASLVASLPRPQALQLCAEAMVRHLGVAFARIWILEKATGTLVLEASAGLYTHLDGAHGRVPVGRFKIGTIASERRAHLTNTILGDPLVPEQEWARRTGLTAFAGYPLLSGDDLFGVLAMFSKTPFEQDTFDGLGVIADLIAQGIQRDTFERELATQTTALRLANSELEQFTYVASHDLQEPLRTIANYLDILTFRFKDQLDEKGRHYIARSHEAAKHLQQLIKNLLIFSKIGHHERTIQDNVSASEVLAETLTNLQVAIAEAGATITAGDLPVVRFNKLQLGQIFQNLISNAIKYHGPTPPTLHIAAVASPGLWTFSFTDNGIGIDPSYFDRIFDLFQRIDVDGVFQGTGVGLALCKKIIAAYGGTIWVESRPQAGSVFSFTIPT